MTTDQGTFQPGGIYKRPLWSQRRYLDALSVAAQAHQGQTVPGSEMPYIVHVVSVAMEVMTAIAAEPVAQPDLAVQSALLHDVIEDTDVQPAVIEARFGHEVCEGVAALSKNLALPKADRMHDSLRRIREQPREIWMVKLADRITNLAPPPSDWTAEKVASYQEEAREILAALGEASAFLSARLAARIELYPALPTA